MRNMKTSLGHDVKHALPFSFFKFTNLIFIVFAVLLSSVPVSASFSEDFDGADPFGNFDYVGAGFSVSSPSFDNTSFAYSSLTSHTLMKYFVTKQNSWSITYKISAGLGVYAFRTDNSVLTNACYLNIIDTNIATAGSGSCSGLPNFGIAVTPESNQWIVITIDDIGSSLRFRFAYANGTEFADRLIQDAGDDTYYNVSVRASTSADVNTWRLDDFFVSSVASSSTNSISWGSDEYFSGDLGTITYLITDSEWSCTTCLAYQIRANIMKGDIVVESQVLSAQAGTLYYPFSDKTEDFGGYTVKLMSYFDGYYLLGLSGTELYSDTTALRGIGTSKIIINSSVVVGQPQTIQFYYGFTVNGACALCGIKVSRLNPDGYYQESFNSITIVSGCCTAGTLYNIPITFRNPGTYKLELFHIMKGIVATITTTAIVINNPTTQNLTTSFINITKTSYILGDEISGNYGVNNANWTNSSYTFYMRVHSYDFGTDSDKLITNQISGFSKKLASIDKECSTELALGAYSSCREYTDTFTAMQGANRISVVAKTSTGIETEMTGINFTLDVKDAQGYGISPDKYTTCAKSAVKFTIYSPLPANFTIHDSSLVQVFSKKINATSGIVVPFTFKKADTYTVTLDKPDGTNLFLQVKIISCETPTPTTAPTDGAQASIDWLGSSSWLAIIILVMFVGIGAMYGGAAGMIGGAMIAIPILYLAPGDYSGHMIPLWIVFLEAAIVFVITAVLIGTSTTKQR